MNELQSINFKIFATLAPELKHETFNEVFQTWIQKKLSPELLIDVADYLHVPQGPGMLLVGLEADYSIDFTDGRPGLRYNRKTPLAGNNVDRLKQAATSAFEACQRLLQDERLSGKLQFNLDEIEVFINDRALVPNTAESYEQHGKAFQTFFQKLFASEKFDLQRVENPRQRFGYLAKNQGTKISVDQALANL